MNSKKILYFIEVEDSADEIFPSLTNNNTHERDSSDEIISTRNLRPRTTLRSLSRGKFLRLINIENFYFVHTNFNFELLKFCRSRRF